jgi:hypothetical protein
VLEFLLFLALIPGVGELSQPDRTPPPVVSSAMDCRVDGGTGRLVCTIELTPPAGEELTWSDALVISAPPRAQPLRSRVSGSGRPPRRIEIGFLLSPGEGGRILVRVRAVTCPVARKGERPKACRSSTDDLRYAVPPG